MRELLQGGMLPYDPVTPEEHETMFRLHQEAIDRYIATQAVQKRIHLLEGLVGDPNRDIRKAARAELVETKEARRLAEKELLRAKAAANKQIRYFRRVHRGDCVDCP